MNLHMAICHNILLGQNYFLSLIVMIICRNFIAELKLIIIFAHTFGEVGEWLNPPVC